MVWLVLNIRGKQCQKVTGKTAVVTFIVDQSDSPFFFFTTNRWQQLQASYCYQQWLKICVASRQQTVKCCSVLPNSRQSHLGEQRTLQRTSLFSLWSQNDAQFWSNWPPAQVQCYFFLSFFKLFCLHRNPAFHICVIFHRQLPRSRLREGFFVAEQNDWKCSGSGAWRGWCSPFRD